MVIRKNYGLSITVQPDQQGSSGGTSAILSEPLLCRVFAPSFSFDSHIY
jgi:hypothetical protein